MNSSVYTIKLHYKQFPYNWDNCEINFAYNSYNCATEL